MNQYFTVSNCELFSANGHSPIEVIETIDRLKVIYTGEDNIAVEELLLELIKEFEVFKFIANGYQSWTETKSYGKGDKQKGLNKWFYPINQRYKFSQYGDYYFQKERKKDEIISYSFCELHTDDFKIRLESLLEDKSFTEFFWNSDSGQLRAKIDFNGTVLKEGDVILDLQIQKLNKRDVRSRSKDFIPKSGWTSWYNYYTNITQEIILENLKRFVDRDIPIDYYQIDDGYQVSVGDWEENEKFSIGMKAIADEIKAVGYKPGIWIAPFICEEKSSIYKDHPDFILKDKNGNKVQAGFSPGWSGKFFALDFENIEVQFWIRGVLGKIVNEWGFELLKMDFLYAACMNPPEGKSRGKQMYEVMSFLKECIGEAELLGCGVPLASCKNIAEYCRIGADVALKWEDKLLAKGIRYRERVSTLAALRNTLYRAALDGDWFRNDPDVFILREEGNKLSFDEKQTLYLVNQVLGSLIFTSDNIDNYDEPTMRQYKMQFPQKAKFIQGIEAVNDLYKISFSIGKEDYQLVANLSEHSKAITFTEGRWITDFEFVESLQLAKHSSIILKKYSKSAEVLWSDGHLFPGKEVDSVKLLNDELTVIKNKRSSIDSNLWIQVKTQSSHISWNQTKIEINESDQIRSIKVRID